MHAMLCSPYWVVLRSSSMNAEGSACLRAALAPNLPRFVFPGIADVGAWPPDNCP